MLGIRDLLKCLIVALAALVSAGVVQTVHHPVIFPIPLTAPYRARDYDFLRAPVRDHSIVQLGESIHLTEEFPRARERMVRFLHEELGFDVIALEGSAVNAWLAMEVLYQSPYDSAATRKAQEIAWFPLWDTDAMYELMAYIAETQSTRDPLYLGSFDMQAGASRGTGDRVFSQLFSALASFAPAPRETGAWNASLIGVKRCDSSYSREDAKRAVAGISEWISRSASKISPVRPAAHVTALRALPATLSQMALLCDALRASGGAGARQVARDSMAASNVIDLRRNVSATHKVIVWAHHNHAFYNSAGSALHSMGERLRAADSASVYTVGLFAGWGRAIEVDDHARIPLATRNLPSADHFSADRPLAAISSASGVPNYFIDLTTLNAKGDSAMFTQGLTRIETRLSRPATLARDFDAAVFVRTVSPPRLLFGGRVLRSLTIGNGFYLDHSVGTVSLLSAAVLLFAGLLVRKYLRNDEPTRVEGASLLDSSAGERE